MQFWPEGDKAPSKANFQALEGALEFLFYFQAVQSQAGRSFPGCKVRLPIK